MSRISKSDDMDLDLNVCKAFELSQKVKGIGVTLSNRIVNERNKNGLFRTWDDVRERAYGVGIKTVNKMQNHGVIVCEVVVNAAQSNQKGFEIHYIDLGPPTKFHNKYDPKLANIVFKGKNAKEKNKRKRM